MVGAMLVGAWLLIHQQCCVTGEMDSRMKSPLVEPLIRRSPLEKNFMRFGRSWSPPQGATLRDLRAKDNFIRFGRDLKGEDLAEENDFQRDRKGGQSFMRFGRDMVEDETNGDEPVKRGGGVNSKGNFIRFGRSGTADWSSLGRATNNFMRFGRGGKDGFLRFGRGGKDGASRKGNGFIRLGRGKRAEEETDGPESPPLPIQPPCSGLSSLDPNTIVAPEFSFLPDLPFSGSSPSKPLMRLG